MSFVMGLATDGAEDGPLTVCRGRLCNNQGQFPKDDSFLRISTRSVKRVPNKAMDAGSGEEESEVSRRNACSTPSGLIPSPTIWPKLLIPVASLSCQPEPRAAAN